MLSIAIIKTETFDVPDVFHFFKEFIVATILKSYVPFCINISGNSEDALRYKKGKYAKMCMQDGKINCMGVVSIYNGILLQERRGLIDFYVRVTR